MGKALYRKYRPTSLNDVAGQEHITTTLANAIKSGKISHAYLLTGPKGVGKTSIARILAHELNGLEYQDTGSQLDIIEIDAASNRRIDEVRDLRDKVHILPTSSKYKVYIIDEVHMLTREAFNALLKTLEEPPEHVIFVLATTEAHKLPETIISRTQHFTFKPIENEILLKRLKQIAKSEKISIDDDALKLVAIHGGGSFRDSISLLDQARSFGDNVKASDVERMLGIAPESAVSSLQAILETGTPKQVFAHLSDLRAQGLESAKLATQLSQHLKTVILDDQSYQTSAVSKLLYGLLNVTGSPQADRLLELVLLDYVLSRSGKPESVSTSASSQSSKAKIETASTTSKQVLSDTLAQEKEPLKKIKEKIETKTLKTSSEESNPMKNDYKNRSNEPFTTEAWPVVLAAIKKKYNTLYGILRMAEPSVEGNTLTLGCGFSFHQKQINESKNRKIISDIIQQQTGQDIEINCIVIAKKDASGNAPSKTKATLTNVSDIFGGAEVLES